MLYCVNPVDVSDLQCTVSLFDLLISVPQDSRSLCVSAGVYAAGRDDSSRTASVCRLGRGVSVPGLHRGSVRAVQRSVSVRRLSGRRGLHHLRRRGRIRLRAAASGVARIRGGCVRSISAAAAADGPHAVRDPPFTCMTVSAKETHVCFLLFGYCCFICRPSI